MRVPVDKRLEEYRRKRDLAQSPEPDGSADPGRGPAAQTTQLPRFVVQEHHARSLHWDFRLEVDGVLRSWAVPKGPPLEEGLKRLAIATEDHPLSYIDFAGTIPEGHYGAGEVIIWDRGHYETLESQDDRLLLRLDGERLRGYYYLVRTGGRQWLMWRTERCGGRSEARRPRLDGRGLPRRAR